MSLRARRVARVPDSTDLLAGGDAGSDCHSRRDGLKVGREVVPATVIDDGDAVA